MAELQGSLQLHGVEREWGVVRQLADQSPIMVKTITLKRLIKRGYESMLNYYRMVSPHLCAKTLWCAGTT